MSDVRTIARPYLKTVLDELDKRGDKQLWTDRKGDSALYTDLCAEDLVGTTFKTIHAKLVHNWDVEHGIMTSCLSFVLTYAKRLGFQMRFPGGFMASFNVDTTLDTEPPKSNLPKKGYAWVSFGGDKRPKYGDVVLFSHEHIGISLEVDGDTWNTVESGQGGPGMRRDILEKKTQTYKDRGHLGWVDLELYFGPAPSPQQVDSGKTGMLWLNQDGDVVHPDSPSGGGGPGYFAAAGYSPDDVFDDALPHPRSPSAQTLDPLAISEAGDNRGEA